MRVPSCRSRVVRPSPSSSVQVVVHSMSTLTTWVRCSSVRVSLAWAHQMAHCSAGTATHVGGTCGVGIGAAGGGGPNPGSSAPAQPIPDVSVLPSDHVMVISTSPLSRSQTDVQRMRHATGLAFGFPAMLRRTWAHCPWSRPMHSCVPGGNRASPGLTTPQAASSTGTRPVMNIARPARIVIPRSPSRRRTRPAFRERTTPRTGNKASGEASDADDDLVARELRDAIHASGIDLHHDEILDPDASFALQIDARLDGEHGPAWQRLVRAAAPEARELVRREPDPVAEPMAIHRETAVCLDNVTGQLVQRRSGRQRLARLRRRDGLPQAVEDHVLGCRDEPVDVAVLFPRLADEERPRHVAPVALDLGPEVEEQDATGFDRAPARRP